MRKFILILAILTSFQSLFSQDDNAKRIRHEFDSLRNTLSTLTGTEKVDCLNNLTRIAFDLSLGSWQAEADTARPYAIQANKEAKRIGYKKGLGNSYLNLERIDCMMFGTYAQREKRFDLPAFNSAEQNAKNAITIGEELKDYNMLGEAYYVLHWLVGETKNTGNQNQYINKDIDYIKKAIEYISKTTNKHLLARSYEDYYYLANYNNDFENGVEAMKKAILIYHELGDWREILACTNLTEFLLIKGEFENAFDYCKRIIDAAEQRRKSSADYKDFFYGQGFAHMTDLSIMAGDYQSALQYIQRGYDYYPTDSFSKAVWASNIGEVYRLMKNYDSALYFLKPFETLQAKDAFTGRIMKGKLRLTNLYISMNQYDHALSIITEMIERADEEKEKYNKQVMLGLKGNFCLSAAKLWFEKKDFQQALKYAKEALTLIKYVNLKIKLADNYFILSDIYYNLNRGDSAYYYLKQGTATKDSLLNRQFYFRLNSYKKQAEEERKTSYINSLNKDNQLKEQKLKQQAFVKNSLIIGIILLFLLGVFIFRNLSLKRKNDKLRLQKNLEMQQLANEKKHAELQQQALELEMQALRAQMNPHFIFNCLSSINRFIFKNDNKLASDYLTRFSRLIRMVLMHSQKKLIPLEDELEMLRLYLDLERLRFKDAFDYSITTTNIVDAGAIFIPPLLLQPFCENAVWHGLMHKESKGHLNIIISEVISEHEKVLHCIIEDDGVGREKAAEMKSKSAESEKSLGLKITTERLALLNQENNFSTFYKIEDILNENNEVTGTRVQLKIRHKESVEEFI